MQFSAGSLMPKTDFGQIDNVLFMMDHYNLHKQEAKILNEDFDVWDFVYLHYISPDDHTHDNPVDHQELPFKSISKITLTVNPKVNSIPVNGHIEKISSQIQVYRDNELGRNHTNTLLQPPRI